MENQVKRQLTDECSMNMPTTRPNIFDFATSELTQDAFLIWFLRWSEPIYKDIDPSLHECSMLFINKLLNFDGSFKVKTIEVVKQFNYIDVFCVINEEYAIIIEDKINASEHGNQMTRYSKAIESSLKYQHLQKYCIYFKTGNERQQNIDAIKNKYLKENGNNWHFNVFKRQDMIEVLNSYLGKNEILMDYRDKIIKIEKAFLDYLNLPVSKWSWLTWEGFYSEMELKFEQSEDCWWGAVNPPSGSFACLAWHRLFLNNDRKVKLQIEAHPSSHKLQIEEHPSHKESRLCIKLEAPKDNKKEKMQLLYDYYHILDRKGKENNIELNRPSRFSARGGNMTVAYVNIESIIFGEFNLSQITENLRKYQKLLDDFVLEQSLN